MERTGPDPLRPESASDPDSATVAPVRTLFGVHPLKLVFALEYMLQGLANPFQGVTYQPFFRHLRVDYGLSEAATQGLFAKSYLAWSFKPLLGFLIDAYGKTRVILLALLGLAALGYLLTPLVDTGPLVFFGVMFGLSIALAATDVAVDRATVLVGEEEANRTGRSKATTVGLNQAICWTSIYGTGIVAAVFGGYVAEHVPFNALLIALAGVPLVVLAVAALLPRDRAPRIPLARSVAQFWSGLNSGPVLGVMLFYFIFHFQPALGPLWNDHLIQDLRYSQTEIGIGDGASNVGAFIGVLLFASRGVKWQERVGLRKLFRTYIVASAALGLSQYTLVEPWFGTLTGALGRALPFLEPDTVRVVYLCLTGGLLAIASSLINMSTFSLVGAVIPAAAAGSLFAGFMSVANLAYSFSYSSGAWLYDHGMSIAPLRTLQAAVFSLAGGPSDKLAIEMLILIGSLAYVTSFAAVHLLPDRRGTCARADEEEHAPGPERWLGLPKALRRSIDISAMTLGAAIVLWATLSGATDLISSLLLAFFGATMLRKLTLDLLLWSRARA